MLQCLSRWRGKDTATGKVAAIGINQNLKLYLCAQIKLIIKGLSLKDLHCIIHSEHNLLCSLL